MIYRKNIKEILNVNISDGDLHILFSRVDDTHFGQSFTMETCEICEACGELLNNGDDHSECKAEIVDELYVAQEIQNSLENGEIVEINYGEKDCIYISL